MAGQSFMIVDGVLADNIAEIAAYIDSLSGEETMYPLAVELRSASDDAHCQELYFALAEGSSALLQAPITEFEPAYNLLLHVLSTAPDFNTLLPVILANLASDVPESEAQQVVILAVLGNLFNLLPDESAHQRLVVFSKVLDFASAANSVRQLVPQLDVISKWVVDWSKVDSTGAYEIASRINDLLERASPKESYRFVLNTCREGIAELAPLVATRALESPFVYDFDEVLALSAIQQKPELVSEIQEVANGNAKGTSRPAAQKKASIFALAKISSEKRELSYSEVAAATGVSESVVEPLIVDAVKSGLLEARMNQLKSKLSVERVVAVGEFSTAHWQEIDNRLEAWKKSLEAVRDANRSASSESDQIIEYKKLLKA